MPEEEFESNKIVSRKRAQTSHNFYKSQAATNKPDRMQLQSANLNKKSFNPILRESEGLAHNKIPNSTSQGFFNRKNQIFVNPKSSKVKGRFNQNYLNEMEKFAQTNSTGFNFSSRPKKYDGFESYKVPRTKKRSKSEFQENSVVKNYSKQMLKSLRIGPIGVEEKDLIGLNQLCEDENQKLRMIISNQANSEFLAKAKLPKIAYIVNQPKFLMSNSRTQFSKNLGEKYNPHNYKFDHKNNFKRNINGGHFLY
jgi:hypothetical protein